MFLVFWGVLICSGYRGFEFGVMVEEVKKEHGKGEKVQGVVTTSWFPASDGSFEMKASALPGYALVFF